MKNYYSGKYIVITGASMGLGKSLAARLAAEGCHLILLSLPGENLPILCDELSSTYGVKTLHYETDLSLGENINGFADWVLSQNLEISGLVNNAGLGGSARFEKTDPGLIDTMLLVNIRALTLLTRLFIEELKSRDKSFILNVSSIAAFKPMPYKTVYPASKAYVYSFSVGLGEELKATGVQVSVLHPGPMDTSDENAGRIEQHGFLGKLVCLTVDEVADIAVSKMMVGKKVIVPGIFNKLCARLMKMIPRRIALPMINRVVKKELYKEVEKQKA